MTETNFATPANAPLAPLFTECGLSHAEPAILQSAELFLDLTGEDIRRRLLLVQSPDGTDACLRPDYTIPVARDHIAAGAPAGGYWYHGPVFRYRAEDGAVQIEQTGAEFYGQSDHSSADVNVLRVAIGALNRLGVSDMSVRMGDPGLLTAAINAFDLPAAWVKRLKRGFARPGGIADALKNPAAHEAKGARSRLVEALAGADPVAATAMVEELVGMAGITAVGGRSAGEIAERLMEEAELAQESRLSGDIREHLVKFASIEGEPAAAADAFAAIASEAGINIDAGLQDFAARADALKSIGRPIAFSAGFGRRLDYYSGFVFEIHDPANPDNKPLAGGGRYDGLLKALGGPEDQGAVGFSIWLERARQAASGGKGAA